jgi:hypothetical protein
MMEDTDYIGFLLCYSSFLWALVCGSVLNSAVRMEQVPVKYRLVTHLILEGEYHKESMNTHETLLLCCSGVSRPAE